jgi:hypothetical protein
MNCIEPQPLTDTPPEQAERDLTDWLAYISCLSWRQGCLDDSSYKAALNGASLKLSKEIVLVEIRSRIESAGDWPSDSKITSQVERAYNYVNGGGDKLPRAPKATFRPGALRTLAEKLPVEKIVEFIMSRSPIDPAGVTSGKFLSLLYRTREKVVIFTDYESQGQAIWPEDALPTSGKEGVWYLINPVDGRPRKNPRTRTASRRSAESVTSFRFALLESDQADFTEWLKCLAQLPLRIVAIYESGGRSIHALVQVDAASKAEWDAIVRQIKPLLVTLGADGNALTAVRLSRLPQAKRGDRVQRLLYLAPNPNTTPICQKAPREQPTI